MHTATADYSHSAAKYRIMDINEYSTIKCLEQYWLQYIDDDEVLLEVERMELEDSTKSQFDYYKHFGIPTYYNSARMESMLEAATSNY